jgi:hypothetical protein
LPEDSLIEEVGAELGFAGGAEDEEDGGLGRRGGRVQSAECKVQKAEGRVEKGER